jgi:hypothetical protein
MLNLDTGRKTRKGETIRIGDTLKGGSTHEVVVVFEHDSEELVVEAVEDRLKIMSFKLDKFISSWSDLEVTGSILKRVLREY